MRLWYNTQALDANGGMKHPAVRFLAVGWSFPRNRDFGGNVMVYNQIKQVLPHFRFEGYYVSAEELHSGNINNTYHLQYRKNGVPMHYLLQNVNTYVFHDPYAVMENIEKITDHLRRKYLAGGVDPTRRVLEIIPTIDGRTMHKNGGYWRAYRYIENATAYDRVMRPKQFEEAGRAFGEFQRMLCDFPAGELHTTIPDFHNTTKRFYAFVRAVSEDKAGRVRALEPEIEFMFEHRRAMGTIVRELERGVLPLRVMHNDTKINNVMIDNDTDKAVCVIDLDTVMPGSALYDYGDAIRFGASTAAEDEEDTSKIALDMEKFKLFTRGFLSQVDGFLTPHEIELLPLGMRVITCELAMRFLTDYIEGDLYFKVKSPTHNLIRARAQMALLEDMERKADEVQAFIDGRNK